MAMRFAALSNSVNAGSLLSILPQTGHSAVGFSSSVYEEDQDLQGPGSGLLELGS